MKKVVSSNWLLTTDVLEMVSEDTKGDVITSRAGKQKFTRTELINCQLSISWMLLDVDPACLKTTPPHFCVESNEPEARVPGKSTIIILQKMSEVIANGYLVAALSKEVGSSCWKQGGEGHKYPSVVNSLIGAPPMVGHIRV